MRPWLEIAPGMRLTGDGAAWLPECRTIVVADVHVGYELATRRRGGYLPSVASGEQVGRRIVEMASAAGAERVVIAGDFRHSTRDVDDREREEIQSVASVITATCRLDVIRGNHDAGTSLLDAPMHAALRLGDVEIVHEPPREPREWWTLCGHLHPRVTLRDETGAGARYPCALVGRRIAVLPAFSAWAGGAEARSLVRALPVAPWQVFPVHGGEIADVGIVYDTRASGEA